MKINRLHCSKYAWLLILIVPLCVLNGCVDTVIHSAWKDHEIVVDGKDNDWPPEAMIKEKNVAFGICNDNENLYMCLSITDKITKAQLMGLFKQDFCVWIDTATGMEYKRFRNFGIRFSNNSAFMDEDLISKTRYLQVQSFQVIADEMMSHLTIQVMQNLCPVASLVEAKGIDSAISVSKNGRQLIYELKIPLLKNAEHPYAIGAVAGKPLYIGLETSPINVDMIQKQLWINESRGKKDEVSQERMGGRGGVMRSMSADMRRNLDTEIALENFRPIQIWCKVILVQKS